MSRLPSRGRLKAVAVDFVRLSYLPVHQEGPSPSSSHELQFTPCAVNQPFQKGDGRSVYCIPAFQGFKIPAFTQSLPLFPLCERRFRSLMRVTPESNLLATIPMSSRSETIRNILASRRPMADKVSKADEALDRIESQIRNFRQFVPQYAKRLDPEAASAVAALEPETELLLASIAQEKGKLAVLAGRFSRTTLNIGVAGRAGQGKSTLLQQITGLTDGEIPTGDKGHCTGAPSLVTNQDFQETNADITFHTETSFLEGMIAPFFAKLKLGDTPYSLDGLSVANLPVDPPADSLDPTSDKEHLRRLHYFAETKGKYRHLLTGQTKRVSREEIRSFIAQEGPDGSKWTNWIAVQMVSVNCRFPQADVGTVALADTPGLGDFISGAEDRLVATVGKSLDVILFVRRPPEARAVIEPADTNLHGLISRAIPGLRISEWSYFLINRDGSNAPNLDFFKDNLKQSAIKTREIYAANCRDRGEVSVFLDSILSDIANNLGSLDQKLLSRQQEDHKALAAAISVFAERAAGALPRAGILQPDLALLNRLFNEVWKKLASGLLKLVEAYKKKRLDPDEDFLNALSEIYEKLDKGPTLPAPDSISEEAAAGGLMKWHADKLNELRVSIANSFEPLDSCLHAGFEQLRGEIIRLIQADEGGRLNRLHADEGESPWQTLLDRWKGHEGGDVMVHAIDLLMSAGLSFRGFIQPRVRHCIDVLDSDSTAAQPFGFVAGDIAELVREKLEMAWQRASYNCKSVIQEMASEPAMARFAAAEDFREAILHSGGEARAKQIWSLFYHEGRAELWPDEFGQLEADTRLRKEWEACVNILREASTRLAEAV